MTTTLIGTPDPEPEPDSEHEVSMDEAIVRAIVELDAWPIE